MHKILDDEEKQELDNPQANRLGESNNHVVDSFLRSADGSDEPMDESHPYAPAMITLGTYPLILGLVGLGALIFWFFYG